MIPDAGRFDVPAAERVRHPEYIETFDR